MSALFTVILPVFLVIGFGWVATWRGLFPDSAVEGLMRFAQNFAVPVLLFSSIAKLDLGAEFSLPLLGAFYTGAFASAILAYFGARFWFGRSAQDAVARLNPHVAVMPHPVRLTADNARGLLAGYDVVADGSDNFDTRYAVSDACFHERKVLVTAALGQFDASLTTIRAHETSADGQPNPTYRCLFPSPPPAGAIPTCAEAGVLGALAGVMGAMMALEVIREIVGFGEGLVGRLLMVDALSMRFETLRYGWDDTNPLSGARGDG